MSYDVRARKLINARDIGGLKTTDGKKIVKGRLFRSGRLSDLPKNTVEKIKRLNVRTVLDLRTNAEVGDQPDS